MAPTNFLLGPPELHEPKKPREPPPTPDSDADTDPSFMDLMVSNFNETSPPSSPTMMGRTKRKSATYLSSGNPCTDFFFNVTPTTPSDSVQEKVVEAWNFDALTTLKLICNLRGVRGSGKSDKESFFTCALWLHNLHPKTLACNIHLFADFGCFKDLPEIIFRVLKGANVRNEQKSSWLRTKGKGYRSKRVGKKSATRVKKKFKGPFQQRKGNAKSSKPKPSITRRLRVTRQLSKDEIEKEKASKLRKEKKLSLAKAAIGRYSRDPDFRFLYDRVSDFFADCLKSDMEHFRAGELKRIGLAAKWCPSLDSSFDRATLLCESIARKVFPKEVYPEYEGVEDSHYAYGVRDRLRKEVLVPLRKALQLPEVYIGANKWGSVPYERVASVAMNFYKEKFLKHDPDRFNEYLEKVKLGKAKISSGALLPHEIIWALDHDDGGQVAELQWTRMINDLKEKGKLKNCLAICDMSDSMIGLPMEVGMALSLLVSELSEEPWKGKFITFSAEPKLHKIEGNTLFEKVLCFMKMEWSKKANFQKVFDIILKMAVKAKLRDDQMIKRVLVFSNMEFDKASSNRWETDYRVIQRKFSEKGYGNVVPEIVFWNLKNSRITPVPSKQKGVALLSGFSKNLMKLLMEDRVVRPEDLMEAAISGPEYQDLVVLD